MRTSRIPFVFAVVTGLWVAACAPQPEPVDLEAERQALRAADQAWSNTPPDVEAFASYLAEEAYFLPAEAPMAQGVEEIRSIASQLFTAPGFSLTWTAIHADVSSAGDLGYTVGTFQLQLNDPQGNPVQRSGKYTTVWKKQEDGQWKVVADVFNYNEPAPAPPTPAPAQ